MTTAKRTSLALHIQRTLALLTGSKNGTVAFSDARSRREPKNDNAEHQHSSSESRTAVPLPQPLVLSRNASVDIADMISDHDPDAAEIEARLLRSPVLSDSDTETSRSWSSAHRLHDDSSSDGEGEDGGSYRLLGVDEIPDWMRDNELILTGYRPITKSVKRCMRSIFKMHNETVNIWSHVFGHFLFASLPPVFWLTGSPPRYKVALLPEYALITLYLLGVSICFLFSSLYHTLLPHSPRLNTLTCKADYLGIIILMYTATLPMIYYGLICSPKLQSIYYGITSLFAALTTATILLPDNTHRINTRLIRAAIFASFGASGIIPIIHAAVQFDWGWALERMALVPWFVAVVVLNAVGCAAYAARVPERWLNGKVDLWGNGHQILHFAVLAAAAVHVGGLVAMFEFRHFGRGRECAG